MRLKTSMFLWVFVATAAPLTLLTLAATAYSEAKYRQEVHRDINASLGNIASEIRRRLLLERELIRGLAEVPAVHHFLPVLARAARGEMHPQFYFRASGLEQFLAAFQSMIPSMSLVRVLDVQGNTLLMVEAGRRAEVGEQRTSVVPYVARRVVDPAFTRFLAGLPAGEVGYFLLPRPLGEEQDDDPAPVFDTFLALGDPAGGVVGYLMAAVRRGPIDRLLHVTPRLQKGDLLIAELNPDQPERDGLVLYDDRSGLTLGGDRLAAWRLQEDAAALYARAGLESDGVVDSEDGAERTYFTEYMPYPDQLIAWIVASRVDSHHLSKPFAQIHLAILGSALVALVLSLVLAQLTAHSIAGPVMHLASSLTAFANGAPTNRRVIPRGAYEVRQAGSAFNEMADALERAHRERDQAQAAALQNAKLASLGQMAAGIGHEINNPLNNILSLARLIERSLPARGETLHADVQSLREEALRASRIVKAVLNFARQVPPTFAPFEIGPWLKEIVGLLHPEAVRAGVTVVVDVGGRYSLVGDRDLLGQAVVNLLQNALQASPAGTEVGIVARERDGALAISVTDQGPGIESANLDRVFDPFFTTKPVGQGSGLGLSIAVGIVQRHGGELSLRNRSTGGVEALLVLPRLFTESSALSVEAETT